MGWANRITLARAALTLGLWGLIAYASGHPSEGLWLTAFWIFIIASATDFVDGMLARKLQEVSVFGRIADPLGGDTYVDSGHVVAGTPKVFEKLLQEIRPFLPDDLMNEAED